MARKSHPDQRAAIAAAVALLCLAVVCTTSSIRWVGRTFPGFLVLRNAVVASAGLAGWTGLSTGEIFQRQILTVNGEPVAGGRQVNEIVTREPAGSAIAYRLADRHSMVEKKIASMVFSAADYLLLFGVYLLNGLIFAAAGLAVLYLRPGAPGPRALATLSVVAGAFAISATDLYGPYRFFRLHVASEALLPAAFIHLGITFPILLGSRRLRKAVLWAAYALAGALVLLYEFLLDDPAWYPTLHAIAVTYLGFSACLLFVNAAKAYRASASALVRQRTKVVGLGIVGGFGLPTVISLASGLSGSDVSFSFAGFTAPLFPISLAYAIAKHDLFEIDTVIKRSVYYLTATLAVTIAYALLIVTSNRALLGASFTQHPAFPLGFTLAALLILAPLRDKTQRALDRMFFRCGYDLKATLEALSSRLSSAREVLEIAETLGGLSAEVMFAGTSVVLVRDPKTRHFSQVENAAERGEYPFVRVPPASPLVECLSRFRRAVLVDELLERDPDPVRQTLLLSELGVPNAAVVVPFWYRDELVGFMILAAKKSGALYTGDDMKVLSTAGNQAALGVVNSLAYREIQRLNRDLEATVARRTEELRKANESLEESLEGLERAYEDLKRSQESLLRAEKMATLGQLTAGIAHEVNTPLGAALNSLHVIADLAQEYAESIGDPSVTDTDHRQIARELESAARCAVKSAEKAARFIRSIKNHSRASSASASIEFPLADLLEETRLLLEHQFRVADCWLEREIAPADLRLRGDPAKLEQVIANLLTNAIDAYDELKTGGPVRVAARLAADDKVLIAVSDQGCGIPREDQERIFDLLFTTKARGKGTGLGLSIVKHIVENEFGGEVAVESQPGKGTTFRLSLPRHASAKTEPPAAAPSELSPPKPEASRSPVPEDPSPG